MANIWFVRAGKDSIYVDDFLQSNMVAVGWSELGEIDENTTKSQLTTQYKMMFPDDVSGRVYSAVGQLYRFIHEMQIDDIVMTYDRNKQIYYLGNIKSVCMWNATLEPELRRFRNVQWLYFVARNTLSITTRNTLGAIQTLFQVKDSAAKEVESQKVSLLSSPNPIPAIPRLADQDAIDHEIRLELLEKSDQSIEDRIQALHWEQMQELVAGILRAMGYRTRVSPRGADRGVDIFASPDGLGLQEPRIFVEVKHRTASMGSQDIRSFLGGRKTNDRCLYISTGGYSKDARYEADRSSIPITLLGVVELRRLFVEYYENLDEETKSLIPLKKVYVLAD